MTVAEYLAANKMSINALAKATGISYTTLHPHVRHGKELSVETARRLEEWSEKKDGKGRISAAEVLELKPAHRRAKAS